MLKLAVRPIWQRVNIKKILQAAAMEEGDTNIQVECNMLIPVFLFLGIMSFSMLCVNMMMNMLFSLSLFCSVSRHVDFPNKTCLCRLLLLYSIQ
ncbi:unnamed protein product [Brassica oleracea]